MKIAFFVALSFLFVDFDYAGELRVWQGDLYFKHQDKLILVKKDIAESLRGYAVVNENTVFLAYQPEDQAEASTILSLVDVRTGKEKRLDDIGGTGESFFDYNKDNGLVAFNLWDGIYVFKLDKYKAGDCKKVISVENCYEVFWVDASTIGYTDQHENKKKLAKVQ